MSLCVCGGQGRGRRAGCALKSRRRLPLVRSCKSKNFLGFNIFSLLFFPSQAEGKIFYAQFGEDQYFFIGNGETVCDILL